MTTQPAGPTPAATYVVRQKLMSLANRYEFHEATPEFVPTRMLGFAQQKMMKLKEEVIFYTDESKTARLFSFKAQKVMDIHGATDIMDANGSIIGHFRKDFGASLISSTFYVGQPGLPELKGTERSTAIAVLRRVMDIGFVPYHFDFVRPDGAIAMSVVKKWGFRDVYQVSIFDTSYDLRVLAAMAVATDVLQQR